MKLFLLTAGGAELGIFDTMEAARDAAHRRAGETLSWKWAPDYQGYYADFEWSIQQFELNQLGHLGREHWKRKP